MSRPRLGIISNPKARRNRAQLDQVGQIVANHPAIHHFISSHQSETASALKHFAGVGVNVLAINGGDGTIARVLTELLNLQPFSSMPSIVLLPGGTTNMNASDIGMRGRLKKNLQLLVRWADTGHSRVERVERCVLRVQHEPDAPPRCGMFFGAGSIVQGMEYCQDRVHAAGFTNELGPAVTSVRAIWGMLRKDPVFTSPLPLRIELDSGNDTSIREVNLLLVSSLERLFLGFHPYWGEENAPLHCTWIQKPARRLLRIIPYILRGRRSKYLTRNNGYYSVNAGQIRLWMDASYAIDGEIYPASSEHPIIVDNGGTLQFLRIGQ